MRLTKKKVQRTLAINGEVDKKKVQRTLAVNDKVDEGKSSAC